MPNYTASLIALGQYNPVRARHVSRRDNQGVKALVFGRENDKFFLGHDHIGSVVGPFKASKFFPVQKILDAVGEIHGVFVLINSCVHGYLISFLDNIIARALVFVKKNRHMRGKQCQGYNFR